MAIRLRPIQEVNLYMKMADSEAKRDGENLLNVLLNNEIVERRLMICSD